MSERKQGSEKHSSNGMEESHPKYELHRYRNLNIRDNILSPNVYILNNPLGFSMMLCMLLATRMPVRVRVPSGASTGASMLQSAGLPATFYLV